MPKFALDRIKKKYGFTGKKYQTLMTKIIANNNELTQKAVGRLNKEKFNKTFKKTGTKIVLPNVEEVLPKRSVFLRKGADRGELINEKLRDTLTRNMRDTIASFKSKTGKPSFLKLTGKRAGQINPDLVKEFRKTITNTFTSYTKKKKGRELPTNIDTIATTEMRATVSDIKEAYVEKLEEKNPDKIRVEKEWIQHRSLSKVPRRGHSRVDKTRKPKGTAWKVYTYVKIGKRYFIDGFDMMQRPHDPTASAGNVISCHCEAVYKVFLIS